MQVLHVVESAGSVYVCVHSFFGGTHVLDRKHVIGSSHVTCRACVAMVATASKYARSSCRTFALKLKTRKRIVIPNICLNERF